jgi:predicted ester cyclase
LTDEAFVHGKVEVIDELMADDFVTHDPPPGLGSDRAGQRAIAELVASALSGPRMEFDDYVETTDGRVVQNWAMVGTHVGEAFGLAPSHQEVRVRGMELWRVADGKLVEHWGVVDMSDLVEKATAAAG